MRAPGGARRLPPAPVPPLNPGLCFSSQYGEEPSPLASIWPPGLCRRAAGLVDPRRRRPGHVHGVSVQTRESGSAAFTQEMASNTAVNPASCLQDGTVVDKRPVPKQECSLDFLDLIPGHAYSLTVQSLSGKLTNEKTGLGRTGR